MKPFVAWQHKLTETRWRKNQNETYRIVVDPGDPPKPIFHVERLYADSLGNSCWTEEKDSVLAHTLILFAFADLALEREQP